MFRHKKMVINYYVHNRLYLLLFLGLLSNSAIIRSISSSGLSNSFAISKAPNPFADIVRIIVSASSNCPSSLPNTLPSLLPNILPSFLLVIGTADKIDFRVYLFPPFPIHHPHIKKNLKHQINEHPQKINPRIPE